MKITITGSLGNVSKLLTEKLIKEGHEVSVVTSKKERVPRINAMGGNALLGRLDDEAFIQKAFKNADAIYTMVPPSYQGEQEIRKVAAVYAKVIAENSIPYVVNLSGIGSHLINGPGPAGANYQIEKLFNSIHNSNVLHLRPGIFYSNFYGVIGMIRSHHMIGNNFSGNIKLAFSHPADIAQAAFEAIHYQNFKGKSNLYVVSAEITGNEIAKIFGNAFNMSDMQWVEFSDQVMLENLIKQGLTAEMAKTYIIDMGISLRDGTLLDVYFKESKGIINEATSFEKFAEEFKTILF